MINDSLARQLEDHTHDGSKRRMVAIEGGGLDARAREGVPTSFYAHVILAVGAVVLMCCIGAARVALTTSTVSILQTNEEISSQIKELRTLNSSLRIEHSLLTGSDRIGRIATQNYEMVHANEVEYITLDGVSK